MGYSEFIERSSTEPMVNFTAKIIRESGLSLARTSNAFIDLNRLEFGQLKVNCSTFHFNELVSDLVELYQSQSLDLDLDITFTCYSDCSFIEMYSDEKLIRQIVDALIFNSIICSKEAKSLRVDIFISDCGNLVKLVLIERILPLSEARIQLLKNFWNSMKYKYELQEGPGVELAFVKALINHLQGCVEFQSLTENNSQLIVMLPLNYKQ